MPRLRIPLLELFAGVGGSIAVLAVILARPPGWDALATVGATLLPAGLVLYGATAARRAREAAAQRTLVDEQRTALVREAAETTLSRAELQRRLGELVALNELASGLSSTLDLDELLDRALDAVVHRLPFDRALVLLVDPVEGVLTDGRAIGGTAEVSALVGQVHLSLDGDPLDPRPARPGRGSDGLPRRRRRSVRAEPPLRPGARGHVVPRHAAGHERPDGRDPRGRQPPHRPRARALDGPAPVHGRIAARGGDREARLYA